MTELRPSGAAHPIDVATRLSGDPASRHRTATVDGSYWTFIGPFVGTTAATLVRAVLDDPDRDGDPIAVTVNYCAPIAKGRLDIAVRLTLAHGGDVLAVEYRQDLDPVDGIGAILRY